MKFFMTGQEKDGLLI